MDSTTLNMQTGDVDDERDVQEHKPGGDLVCVVAILSGLVLCLLGVVVMLLTNPNAYEYLNSNEPHPEKEARSINGRRPDLEKRTADDETRPPPCLTKQCVKTSSYFLNKMDFSVNPCDDLYLYACGGLHAKTRIPRKNPIYLYSETDGRFFFNLQKILSSNDTELFGKKSSAVAKMKMFYQMCMDEEELEEKKTSMLLALIGELGSWTLTTDDTVPFDNKTWSLQTELTTLHRMGFNVFFRLDLMRDPTTMDTVNIPHLLPNDETVFIQFYKATTQFPQHVLAVILNKVQALGGKPSDVAPKAVEMIKFLNSLLFRNERPDPDAVTVDSVQQLLGTSLDLKKYLGEMFGAEAVAGDTQVYCTDPDYFASLGVALSVFKSDVIANILVVDFLEELRNYLPADFRPPATATREDTCTEQILNYFSPPATALYAQNILKPETKSKVTTIAESIRKQIIETFEGVRWFDDEQKSALIQKAQAIRLDIGYPDWILDPVTLDNIYDHVAINPDDVFMSVLSIQSQVVRQKLHGQIGEPSIGRLAVPDSREAYFPLMNNILFVSSVLQPPGFSPHFPTPMQYGGIGRTLGHEIMHAFDNVRIFYNENAFLEPSITPDFNETYMKGVRCLIDMYSSLSHDGVRANGYSSVHEDVADNEGIRLAYKAYKALGELSETSLPGLNLTDDQMFFVAYAQKACIIDVDNIAMLTESHNHLRIRVRGVASNSEEFSRAFSCPPNAPMNPTKKCTIF